MFVCVCVWGPDPVFEKPTKKWIAIAVLVCTFKACGLVSNFFVNQ